MDSPPLQTITLNFALPAGVEITPAVEEQAKRLFLVALRETLAVSTFVYDHLEQGDYALGMALLGRR